MDAANTYLDKTSAANTYLNKVDAAGTYLNKDDAANTYIKQGTAILGDGSVRTAVTEVPADGTQKLMTVDRFFDVNIDGNNSELPAVQIEAFEKQISWATDGKGGTIQPGESATIDFDSATDTQVIQLMWDGDGKPTVGTLSVSAVDSKAFGQILIGL